MTDDEALTKWDTLEFAVEFKVWTSPWVRVADAYSPKEGIKRVRLPKPLESYAGANMQVRYTAPCGWQYTVEQTDIWGGMIDSIYLGPPQPPHYGG